MKHKIIFLGIIAILVPTMSLFGAQVVIPKAKASSWRGKLSRRHPAVVALPATEWPPLETIASEHHATPPTLPVPPQGLSELVAPSPAKTALTPPPTCSETVSEVVKNGPVDHDEIARKIGEARDAIEKEEKEALAKAAKIEDATEHLNGLRKKLRLNNAALAISHSVHQQAEKELTVLRNKQHMHENNTEIFNIDEEDPTEYEAQIIGREEQLKISKSQIKALTEKQKSLGLAVWKAERNVLPAPTTNKYRELEGRSIAAPTQDAGLLPENKDAFEKTREAVKALADLDASLAAMKADEEKTPGIQTKIVALEKRIAELETEIAAIDPQLEQKEKHEKAYRSTLTIKNIPLMTLPREAKSTVNRSSITPNTKTAKSQVARFNMNGISKKPCKTWKPVNVKRTKDPEVLNPVVILPTHDHTFLKTVKAVLGRTVYNPTHAVGRRHLEVPLQKDAVVAKAKVNQQLINRTQKARTVAQIPTIAALHLALKGKVARDEQRRVWTKKELKNRLLVQGASALDDLTEEDRARIEESKVLSACLHAGILAQAVNAKDNHITHGVGIKTDPTTVLFSQHPDRTTQEAEMRAERDRTRVIKDALFTQVDTTARDLKASTQAHNETTRRLGIARAQESEIRNTIDSLAAQAATEIDAVATARLLNKQATRDSKNLEQQRAVLITEHNRLKSDLGSGSWVSALTSW